MLRVLCRCAPTGLPEDRDALDEPPDAARRRDADRVGEHELVRAVEPLAQIRDDRRVDLALERAAPGARDRHGRRHAGAREDRAHALDAPRRATRCRCAG